MIVCLYIIFFIYLRAPLVCRYVGSHAVALVECSQFITFIIMGVLCNCFRLYN
jgi:hypothetical protein